MSKRDPRKPRTLTPTNNDDSRVFERNFKKQSNQMLGNLQKNIYKKDNFPKTLYPFDMSYLTLQTSKFGILLTTLISLISDPLQSKTKFKEVSSTQFIQGSNYCLKDKNLDGFTINSVSPPIVSL